MSLGRNKFYVVIFAYVSSQRIQEIFFLYLAILVKVLHGVLISTNKTHLIRSFVINSLFWREYTCSFLMLQNLFFSPSGCDWTQSWFKFLHASLWWRMRLVKHYNSIRDTIREVASCQSGIQSHNIGKVFMFYPRRFISVKSCTNHNFDLIER